MFIYLDALNKKPLCQDLRVRFYLPGDDKPHHPAGGFCHPDFTQAVSTGSLQS